MPGVTGFANVSMKVLLSTPSGRLVLKRSVELPEGLIDNDDACAAVGRGSAGQKLWPLVALGKGAAKALVGAIRLDGAHVRNEDIEGWRHVAAVIANAQRQREVRARWDAFAKEIGAPTGERAKSTADLAGKVLRIWDDARTKSTLLSSLIADTFSIEMSVFKCFRTNGGVWNGGSGSFGSEIRQLSTDVAIVAV